LPTNGRTVWQTGTTRTHVPVPIKPWMTPMLPVLNAWAIRVRWKASIHVQNTNCHVSWNVKIDDESAASSMLHKGSWWMSSPDLPKGRVFAW
jgi:hypothetical protein